MKETYGKCFGCEQWVLGKRASVCDGCAPRSEYGLHCVSLDLTSCLPFECYTVRVIIFVGGVNSRNSCQSC